MEKKVSKDSSDKGSSYFGSAMQIKRLSIRFTVAGSIVSVAWLLLFIMGLLVDSSYYRAAISYNIAGIRDWLMVIVSFTFSNVILLAFTSGLLGGITSKMRYTKGFTVSEKEFRQLPDNQVENPFVSAFRGMFVFVAILSMQYLSSFTDFGSMSRTNEQTQQELKAEYDRLYGGIMDTTKNETVLNRLRGDRDKALLRFDREKNDSMIVSLILQKRSELRFLKTGASTSVDKEKTSEEIKAKKHKIMNEIVMLRRELKVPSSTDFAGIGISSFSYFKFSVIVSFLAFIFGYDSSMFSGFIGGIFEKISKGKNNGKNQE